MEEDKSDNRCDLPPGGPGPWLVYTHGNSRSKKFQTFCTLSSSPPYTKHCFKSIPQLRGKVIFSSNDGWLVLRDLDNLKIFTLWNPISSQLINLPTLNALEDGVLVSCALVCPPPQDGDAIASDVSVSVFVFVDGTAFSYRPCTDDYTWMVRNTEFANQRAHVHSAVICNGIIFGAVYVQSASGGHHDYNFIIDDIDFNGPITLKAIEAKLPHPEFKYSRGAEYLLVSCGRVYTIGIYLRNGWDRQISAVNIWVLDSCLTKWVRVNDLEGRAFFVGERSRTWCWGSNESGGFKQNSVYFKITGGETFGWLEALYLYNLEDCSLTSLVPCPNLPSPRYIPTWVMPQYQRLVRDEAHVKCIQKIGSLEQDSGFIHCQGLQEQTDLDTQPGSRASEIRESSNALSTVDNQKKTEMLDKILLLRELPLDVIAVVVQKMHLFDYLNFRSTCKQFRSTFPIARWKTNNLYPLLLYFESENANKAEKPLCSLIDPCTSDSYCMVIPEFFRGEVHVDFSMDGWLLLRTNEGKSLHYVNNFTKVGGKFPPSELVSDLTSAGFSSCPTSSDCVTIGISYCDRVCYHRFGEETWHVCKIDYDDDVPIFRPQRSSPVYHKGAFYFLDIAGHLGMFTLVDEEVYMDVYDKPETTPGDNTLHSSHLVECGGELLSVFIGDMGHWVRVFRFNQKKLKWVQVESLGNHMLFVGPSSSFSMEAKEPEMRNRIYLPRLRGNDIIFYALDTGKYGTLMGEKSYEDFSDTKEYLRCTWI